MGLIFIAWQYIGKHGKPLLSFHPFFINTHTWGILGIIGWGYALACIIYRLFKNNQAALLTSMRLLFCVFAADKSHLFSSFGLELYINGECLKVSIKSVRPRKEESHPLNFMRF